MAKPLAKPLIAIVLLLALLQLLYWLGVRRYVDHLAAAVAPVAVLDHGAVVAFPPGQVGLDEVVFSVAGRPDLSLTANRLRLRDTDPAWLGAWLLGRAQAMPSRLTLRLEGVRPSPALLRQLRLQAAASGLILPFEGVGCHPQPVLTERDYDQLGWGDLRFDVNLQLRHDHRDRRLDLALRADRTPGGVLLLDMSFRDVPERGVALAADLGGARLERIQAGLQELGTLAARNRHCAQVQGLDEADYLALHLEQLHEYLGSMGVVPDEPLWRAYGDWLTSGGAVLVQAEPAPGVPFTDYAAFAPEDRLRLLGLSVRFGGTDAVAVEATAAGRKGGVFLPLIASMDWEEETLTAAEAPLGPDADGSWPEPWPVESPDAVGRSDAVTATEPARVDPPATAATPIRPIRPVLVVRRIAFEQLGAHVGRRVRIATVGGNRHTGVVLGATDDALELEITRYGGVARLPIARTQISRIETLTTETPTP